MCSLGFDDANLGESKLLDFKQKDMVFNTVFRRVT